MAGNSAAGDYAGPHTEKRIGQHRATLDDDAREAAGLRDALEWFRTLPVAIEGPGWRCVHACWDPGKLDRLAREDDAWYLPGHRFTHAARAGEPDHEAIDILTKGPKVELPDGAAVVDKDGHARSAAPRDRMNFQIVFEALYRLTTARAAVPGIGCSRGSCRLACRTRFDKRDAGR